MKSLSNKEKPLTLTVHTGVVVFIVGRNMVYFRTKEELFSYVIDGWIVYEYMDSFLCVLIRNVNSSESCVCVLFVK